MTHIWVGNPTIGSDNGLSPGRHQTIIWNQCWNNVNWTRRNKAQWNFAHNSNIYIQENVFENVVCEMAAILSQPQYVNSLWPRNVIKHQHCHRGTKPSPEQMLTYCQLDHRNSKEFNQKMYLKMSSARWQPFYSALFRPQCVNSMSTTRPSTGTVFDKFSILPTNSTSRVNLQWATLIYRLVVRKVNPDW